MSEDDFNLEHLEQKEAKRRSLTLAASGIAEYIRFNCCPRFFKLRLEGDDEADESQMA